MDLLRLKRAAENRFRRPDGSYFFVGLVGLALVLSYSVLLFGELAGAWEVVLRESLLRTFSRNLAALGFVMMTHSTFGMLWHFWREGVAGAPASISIDSAEEDPFVEKLGHLISFLVPRKTRRECFDPFFEDLKADRLEDLPHSGSRSVKCWIEITFYWRLCIAVLNSLVCYLGDTLLKVALFFKGGS